MSDEGGLISFGHSHDHEYLNPAIRRGSGVVGEALLLPDLDEIIAGVAVDQLVVRVDSCQ